MKKKFLIIIAILLSIVLLFGIFFAIQSFNKPGAKIKEMFNKDITTTWVFTGGEAVSGNFEDIRGARNYVGHFEDYIRWQMVLNEKLSGEEQWQYTQNFVTNTAAPDLNLAQIIKNRKHLIENLDPKAVVYMIGIEDYSKTDDAARKEFQKNLNELINTALALRDGQGLLVIQLPFATKNEIKNKAIENYIAAARETVGSRSKKEQKRILLVDHYTQTKEDKDFLEKDLTENDSLNAQGHLLIGKQLCKATIGTTKNYPSQDFKQNSQELDTEEVEPILKNPEFAELQKLVAEKLAGGKDISWMFMGDSITHGAQHTHGYDSISELFHQFLLSIGRSGDIVINSAVSGANSTTTVQQLENRFQRFQKVLPDFVIFQIGTNSEGSDGTVAPTFNENIKTVIQTIRKCNPDAVILLCSPTAARSDSVFAVRAPVYGKALQAIAEDTENTFYLNRYEKMQEAMQTYSWLADQPEILGDNNVHPGEAYHLALFRDLVSVLGMEKEDSPLLRFGYQIIDETKNISKNPELQVSGQTVSVSSAACTKLNSGKDFGEIQLTAINRIGCQKYTATSNGAATLTDLPAGFYTVSISAVERGASVRVLFPSQEVEIKID